MKAINIPEELDVNEIFLNDSQIEIIRQINKAINNGFDNYDKVETDDNNIPIIDCKYYTTGNFNQQNFNLIKHFSVFHLNIHSVEFHIEEFIIVLQLLSLILNV